MKLKSIKCKHFNGVVNEKCRAGIAYEKLVGGYLSPSRKELPCIIFQGKNREMREMVNCELREFLTEKEQAAKEREVEKSFMKIFTARKAITEHMQGKSGRGDIQCPVCGIGKLSFVVSEVNGHIHAKCTTSGCVAWME